MGPRPIAGVRPRHDPRRGDQGVRLPGGFRIPKAEALRLARERIKAQVGRTLTDSKLERLIDDVISTNARLDEHLTPAGG